ncbi:RusA family crossover junction endodeoxyribonuclease [Deinococcus sp. PEB2-63]
MTRFIIPALPCARTTAGKIDRTKPLRPKLVGYYTKGARPNYARMNEYHDWKDHVRANVPGELPSATKEQPVRLDVYCYFASGTHADPENVRKGIVDALFPGGDKFVFGYHHFPQYDAQNPRVEVEVSL